MHYAFYYFFSKEERSLICNKCRSPFPNLARRYTPPRRVTACVALPHRPPIGSRARLGGGGEGDAFRPLPAFLGYQAALPAPAL